MFSSRTQASPGVAFHTPNVLKVQDTTGGATVGEAVSIGYRSGVQRRTANRANVGEAGRVPHATPHSMGGTRRGQRQRRRDRNRSRGLGLRGPAGALGVPTDCREGSRRPSRDVADNGRVPLHVRCRHVHAGRALGRLPAAHGRGLRHRHRLSPDGGGAEVRRAPHSAPHGQSLQLGRPSGGRRGFRGHPVRIQDVSGRGSPTRYSRCSAQRVSGSTSRCSSSPSSVGPRYSKCR